MSEVYILHANGYFVDGNSLYYYMIKGNQIFTVRVYSGKKKELTGVGSKSWLLRNVERRTYVLLKSKEEIKAHLLKIELDKSL